MMGLKSPVSRRPHQQPTFFLNNMPAIQTNFNNVQCLGDHEHMTLQGSDGSIKCTKRAQECPPELCDALCRTFVEHLKR